MEDNIPLPVKMERINIIEKLQEDIQTRINSRLMGKTVEVLVEGRQKGKWYGRTRTDKLVFFSSDSDCTGRLLNTVIDKTSPWSLQGVLE
jgi:tRNA-2-methylthio-N6-dimethylallyladenosine synthase